MLCNNSILLCFYEVNFFRVISCIMPAHKKEALSHEECCGHLCCCCGKKLTVDRRMTSSEEALVKDYGPCSSYDSSVNSYPTGLCASCRRALYKIKAGKPEKSWGGNQPKNWEDFDIDSIFGVRKCGTENFKCDLCNHVRSNPVGTSYSESNVVRIRGTEKKLVQPKEKSMW